MKNYLIKKKKISVHLAILAIIFMMQPAFLSEIPIYSDYDVILRVCIVGVILLIYLKKRSFTFYSLGVGTYILYAAIITIIQHGDVAKSVWGNGLILFAIIIVYEMEVQKNEKDTLKLLFFWFTTIVFINYISLVFFPEGLFFDERGIKGDNFFLGNYNTFITYILPAILSGYLYYKKYNGRLKTPFFILCIISGLSFWGRSVTSLFGFIIIILFLLFFNRKIWRFVFNNYIYLGTFLVAFVTLVVFPNNGLLFKIITSVTGKDITFTGRTDIWQHAIKKISESPLIGYGYQTTEINTAWLGSIHAVHPHNLILGITYETGLIGFVIFIMIFLLTIYRISQIYPGKIQWFMYISIFSFLVMSIFELYSRSFIFFFLGIIYYYCQNNLFSVHRYIGTSTK